MTDVDYSALAAQARKEAAPSSSVSIDPRAISQGLPVNENGEIAPEEDSLLGRLKTLLEPYAHPSSIADIARLMMPDTLLGATGKAGGKATETLGNFVQRGGDSEAAKIASGAGVAGELLRGDIKGAAIAAAAPPVLRTTGNALQVAGQMMSGTPNAVGKVEAIMDAATTPNIASKLTPWQSTFVQSISDQLRSGRALSGAQKQTLSTIYRMIVQ